jgi:hypothetical protein
MLAWPLEHVDEYEQGLEQLFTIPYRHICISSAKLKLKRVVGHLAQPQRFGSSKVFIMSFRLQASFKSLLPSAELLIAFRGYNETKDQQIW